MKLIDVVARRVGKRSDPDRDTKVAGVQAGEPPGDSSPTVPPASDRRAEVLSRAWGASGRRRPQ